MHLVTDTVAPHVGAWIETQSEKQLPRAITSHPTWVRGLKLKGRATANRSNESHPTWVRGLKPVTVNSVVLSTSSHPTWVRGLKQKSLNKERQQIEVAPHVGAWIETCKAAHIRLVSPGRTPRGCVD